MGSVKAELLRLWKWPATWVLIGVWLVMTLTFGYVFNYLALNGGTNTRGQSQQQLINAMQPENVGAAVVRGLPMFGGAIILVLAALAIGSGYGCGTWKTTLTAGPRRVSAMAGTLGALGIIVVILVALTFVVNLGASITVASADCTDRGPRPTCWMRLPCTSTSPANGAAPEPSMMRTLVNRTLAIV